MKRSLELKDKRAEIQKLIENIIAEAEEQKRSLSADSEEFKKLKELRDQREALDREIEAALLIEEEQRLREQAKLNATLSQKKEPGAPAIRTDGIQKDTPENLFRRFSLVRALRNHAEGRAQDGAEAEMLQEGMKEAAELNLEVGGGIYVPRMMTVNPGRLREQRATLQVGTGNLGGSSVFEEGPIFVDFLYPRTVLAQMGAQFLTDLRGDFPIVEQDANSTATWEGELDTNAESNFTIAKRVMQPKRLGLSLPYGIQLTRQSSMDVEGKVREDVRKALGIGLEVAAINGSGTAPVPRGLLNVSGIPTVAMGTNGGALTWAKAVEFESTVAANNADVETMAYLTTPEVVGKAKTTSKAGTEAIFLIEGNMLNGFRVFRSNNVPKNLTKGTGTNLHAMLFGNWSELIIGQWGGIEFVVDPYSRKKEGIIEVAINAFYDINYAHKESFAVAVDIDVS